MIVSVVIPVKNGEEYLNEVFGALQRQEIDAEVEILIPDSGSVDRSVAIARAHDIRVMSIEPETFGHGRTRNLAFEKTRGEYVAFLTQDATPATDTWLAALVDGFSLADRVGAVYGPHLPRDHASPMIANELETFFASMSPGGQPIVQSADAADEITRNSFLSNVNSCIRRACWEEIRFRDVPYAEDQAFGRDMLDHNWQKVFVPQAGVLHSHTYSSLEFARRYFDEYRGLRQVSGHVEPFSLKALAGSTRQQVAADRGYMRERGVAGASLAAWSARSGLHHASRSVFSALGSRSASLPAPMRRFLSLEGRSDRPTAAHAHGATVPHGKRILPADDASPYNYIRKHVRSEPVPLATPVPEELLDSGPLHIAWVIPPFHLGSGGHMTIFNVIHNLERIGHSCSVWMHDPAIDMPQPPSAIRDSIIKNFRSIEAAVFTDFDNWFGADIAMATGWQTAHVVQTLDQCALKAYFVQDFEPDFYAQSAQRIWAEETYGFGMPCIAASDWLANILRERYGAVAYPFQLGVDLSTYEPQPIERDANTVVFYSRSVTPRRGVELGLLALEDVVARRPQTRVVLFGWHKPPQTAFPYEFLGIASAAELAALYSSATVGLNISLTNYSLIPQEMMACGLPVVEVSGFSAEAMFGSNGSVVELAEPNPIAIADTVVELLGDPGRRTALSGAGLDFVKDRTWKRATDTVLEALQRELALRWRH